MRKMSSIILAVSLIGSVLGGVASADERGGRMDDRAPVVVRDHRDEPAPVVAPRTDVRYQGQGRYQEQGRYQRLPQLPPPVVEREHVRPRRGLVWVAGEYNFVRGRWVFTAGHYERARRGYAFVPATWVRQGHGFVKIPGHWDRA